MEWKKLSSRKIFSHPRINLYEDEVELPNGLVTRYLHFGDTTHAAMVIAVNNEGKILVQKEYSYPPDEILYQLPGGAIEHGETPIQGAARELAEEAGLAGELEEVGWFYTNNRRSAQKLYVFVATNLRTVMAEKDPEELFEDFWYTEVEIDSLIITNEIRNYSLLAGWALYKTARQ